MKVTGIIAEYNPFHNGHKYHIEKAKEITGSDYCIIIMSGNFTQRGEPALLHKYSRTEMALQNGADLIIELPVCYACSSAPYFATGAISLLDKLGVTDYVAFGSECGNIDLLQDAAQILVKEPVSYEQSLKSHLKSGLSYPSAQAKAMVDYLSQHTKNSSDYTALLSSPNNILGIEYCKALLSRKSSIRPVTITRKGGGYSDASLHIENSSALAIRTALHSQNGLESIKQQLPHSAYTLMEQYYQKSFPIFPDTLSAMLHYKLLSEAAAGFTQYLDISQELSDRICNKLSEYSDFSSFCMLLKTKEMTYSRISRGFLHILLGILKKDMDDYLLHDWTFYGRILGFKKDSAPLLTAIKANASIPLISKLADAPKQLNETALRQLKQDIQAAHIYNALVQHTYGNKIPIEMQQQIIRR